MAGSEAVFKLANHPEYRIVKTGGRWQWSRKKALEFAKDRARELAGPDGTTERLRGTSGADGGADNTWLWILVSVLLASTIALGAWFRHRRGGR